MARLAALFMILPIVELALLLEVGERVGTPATVAFVLVTGLVGAWLLRRSGTALLRQAVADLQTGQPVAGHLAEGALLLAAALLLVSPGVLTDMTGLLLLLPPVRRVVAPRLVAWLRSRVQVVGAPSPRPTPFDSPFDGPGRTR